MKKQSSSWGRHQFEKKIVVVAQSQLKVSIPKDFLSEKSTPEMVDVGLDDDKTRYHRWMSKKQCITACSEGHIKI